MEGMLFGIAIGDALGLAYEGLSRKKILRRFRRRRLEYRLLPRKGYGSDEIQMAGMTGQALLASICKSEHFLDSLAWRFRWWFLGLPLGIGLGTTLSCIRLWLGFNPENSGGARSAGNGPAVRALVIAATLDRTDVESRIDRWIQLSTQLTHRDERALAGAKLLGKATVLAIHETIDSTTRCHILQQLTDSCEEEQTRAILEKMQPMLAEGISPRRAAKRLGWQKGISGFMPHSATMAIYCWLRHCSNFDRALQSSIRLGGDTDSVTAICGGLLGLSLRVDAIPDHLIAQYADWPADLAWHERLAYRLSEWPHGEEDILTGLPVPFFWPAQIARNIYLIPFICLLIVGRFLRSLIGR